MVGGNKQAFMIMAHSHLAQLKLLVSLLDNPGNDLFIHVDKKCEEFNESDLKTFSSKVVFLPRKSLTWGDYSLVECEYCLLKEALQHDSYAYFHLLSGQDLPIKSNKEIQEFFVGTKEYISGIKGDSAATESACYYYFFQRMVGRHSHTDKSILLFLERVLLGVQRLFKRLGIYRHQPVLVKGNQWFSITRKMAEYLIEQEHWTRKHFHATLCPDEFALQTAAFYSPYVNDISARKTREIDWHRGSPYIYRAKDYDQLMNSEAFFARKFDDTIDAEIIEAIKKSIVE